jgi:UDP-N-acetyl-D-glucosamine dehydrogenase
MKSSHSQALPDLLTSGSPTIGIIGLGVIGTMTAQTVCDAGLSVIGYDSDAEWVRKTISRRQRSPLFRLATDLSTIEDADVVVIAIRMPLSRHGTLVRASLGKLALQLRAGPKRDRLIVMESTLPLGMTRWFAGRLSGKGHGGSEHVAYVPERLKAGQSTDEVRSTPRLVGGLTDEANSVACAFLKRIGVRSVPVSSPEVAELSKLLENAFLTTGICLMGEITRLAHAVGVNATEVATAAATKPRGYLAFSPGAGIGGHCLPNDLRLLQNTARVLRVSTPMLKSLSTSSAELSPTVIRHLETLMRAQGKAIAGSRIWVVGVGFKIGSSDMRRTPAIELVRILRRKKAIPLYSDVSDGSFVVDNQTVKRISKRNWPRNIAAALILSGDPHVTLSRLRSRVGVVLDLGGARIMSGNRSGISTL